MKKTMAIMAVLAVILVMSIPVDAAVRVRGYYRSNGTYVQPHYRSYPDGNFYNNWSTYPNINPYTGAIGTRRTPSYSYNSPTHYFHSYSYPSLSPSYSTPSLYNWNSSSLDWAW